MKKNSAMEILAPWDKATQTGVAAGITEEKRNRRLEIGLRLAIVPGILFLSYLVFLLSKWAMPWVAR